MDPDFVPDRIRHALSDNPNNNGIYVGNVDTAPAEQDRTRLMAAQQGVAYVPATGAGTGYLLFLRDGLLMAQPFDEGRRQLGGEATSIAEQVGNNQIFGSFAASANGTLAYLPANSETRSVMWVGRNSQAAATIAAPSKGRPIHACHRTAAASR